VYTNILSADVSFLNGIKPWLPDFLQKEVAGFGGIAMSLGFIALFVGGVILFGRIGFGQNQHGDASTAGSQISWWIFGVIGLALLIRLLSEFAN
jgi:hypothetical protein